MTDKKINTKIENLKKRVKNFIVSSSEDVEDIHKIRTSSREVLSLLNDKSLNCLNIKKVLKLSNKIRDIDVLLTQFLVRIPRDYHKKINIAFIKEILSKQRSKELEVFSQYLKGFILENMEFLQKEQRGDKSSVKPILSPAKEELHRYRIFIKNQLYLAKNADIVNNQEVQNLTKIKDILGEINDNYNAIKIIKQISKNKSDIKELKRYTKDQNLQNYNNVKGLLIEYKYI